ncbi:MAG: two-component regulator propeller domain-containing protein [Bacteroidales bacterium]
MKSLVYFYLLVPWLLLSQLSLAQFDQTYFFEQISIRDGLSHIGVKDVFQDSKGFIWIGTYDGLNRYDGLNFKTFHHIPNDSLSLINNRVNSILESSDGLIWIGTEEGVCFYNQSTEKFGVPNVNGLPNHKINVTRIYEDDYHRIWVLGSRNAIHIIDKDRNSCQSLYYHTESGQETVFFDIVPGPDGRFLLASNNGLVIINSELEPEKPDFDDNISKNNIRSIEIQNDSIVWIGTTDGLIVSRLINHKDNLEFRTVQKFFEGKGVSSIVIDHESNVWVAMLEDGLNKILYSNGAYEVKAFRNSPNTSNSINTNRIRCVYEDRQAILWIGTAESGLTKYNLSSHVFQNLDKLNTGKNGLTSDIILSFEQLNENLILVGTRGKGVFLLNHSENVIVKSGISFDLIKDQSVSSIYKDSRGIIWIRTWEGLYCLYPGSTELTEMGYVDADMDGICEDGVGNIWLTTNYGLKKLVIGSQNKVVESEDVVLNLETNGTNLRGKLLYNDPYDGTIWMGTFHNGLINIDITGQIDPVESIKYYQYSPGNNGEHTLQSNFITSVLRTSENDIWIGTEGGGLSHGQFNEKGLVFTTYDESNGLSNNVIKAILEDRSGNLWISTNMGLNKFIKDTRQFIVFDYYDGIPSDYFTYAALKISDSLIVFGGNKGLTLFDPDYMKDDMISPIPEFGGFQLFYKTVAPLERISNKVLLEQSLSETEQIDLPYNQNTFSFELLALHYSNPKTNRIKYMLHGFDKEWIYFNKGHCVANYTRIRPGKYQFEFFVANKHGLWSNESRTIDITIHPPVWGTTYAYILYTTIFLIVIIFLVKNSRRILRLKQQVKIKELELLKNKELNESKLRFFVNVSHEFKTPISLISGPAQYLIKKHGNDSRLFKHLSLIKSQSDYLINLLDQLVYFRKAESETLELKCQYKDLIPFVQEIRDLYDWQSKEQNIELNFIYSDTEAFLWFDPKGMDKIFHNLISNAFKFSKPGGKIDIVLNVDPGRGEIIVSVKDRGRGISPESLPHLFKRFYQGSSSQGGYGIGLSLTKSLIELHGGVITVKSIPDKGTEFIISFLTGKDHLKTEQIIMQPAEFAEEVLPDIKNASVDEIDPPVTETANKEKQQLILIVEDNVKMLGFLQDVLKEDYLIETASNGSEALEIIKKCYPDLVLSDVMMPVMDGISLCNSIKSDILSCHIPVVLLTAKSDIDSRIDGLEQGADCYLPKPVEIGLLLAEIKSILINRNRIKERIRMNLPFDTTGEDIHPLDRTFLENVRIVIEQNYSDPGFDSNAFSKKLFINRSQFYKKMKAITNQTPAEFLREFRMKMAVELMVKEKLAVSEVNDRVGILSRPHFIKCFKETYGTLPSEFLKKRSGVKEV